jgi:hypothetical protein
MEYWHNFPTYPNGISGIEITSWTLFLLDFRTLSDFISWISGVYLEIRIDFTDILKDTHAKSYSIYKSLFQL